MSSYIKVDHHQISLALPKEPIRIDEVLAELGAKSKAPIRERKGVKAIDQFE